MYWQLVSQTTINFPVKSVTLVPGTSLINMYDPDKDGFDTIFITASSSESNVLQSLYSIIEQRVSDTQVLNPPVGFQLSPSDSSFLYIDYGIRVDGLCFFHIEQVSRTGAKTCFNLLSTPSTIVPDLETNAVLKAINFLSKNLNRDGFLNIYNTGKTNNKTLNKVRDNCHLEWRFSGFSPTKAYAYFVQLSESERQSILQLLNAQLY